MIGSSFGQQLAQYQTSFLVEEKILAAAASSVTFSNLNALRDGGYTIDILAISNTTGQPNINLIVNGDTNTANYTGRMMYASSSSALGLATTNRISALAPAVGQLCASFTDVAFAGGKISAYTRVTDQFPEVYVVGTQYTPTVSNITSLTIECATASGLAAGTIIRLYRKLNGNTATFIPLQSNLVADILVPSNTTRVDITGLDGNLHGGYTLESAGILGANSTVGALLINGDQTAANYIYGRYVAGASSTAVTGPISTAGVTVLQGDAGRWCMGYADINSLLGYVGINSRVGSIIYGGTAQMVFASCQYNVNTNITSLTILSTQTNGIAAGSRFRLYRRK